MSENKSQHEGQKNDSGKVRFELLSVCFMSEFTQVLTFGAEKYGPHNWRGGFLWSRLIGACLRHVFAFMAGEDRDPESGLSHLAHAACCLMFLYEHWRRGLGTDDRYYEIDRSDSGPVNS